MDYLSRELARRIEVEVHCFGDQHEDRGGLHVRGDQPWAAISDGTEGKFKGALEACLMKLGPQVRDKAFGVNAKAAYRLAVS